MHYVNIRDNVSEEYATDIGLRYGWSFNNYVSVPPCFISNKIFSSIVKIVRKFVSKNSFTVYSSAIMHKGFFRHLVLRKAKTMVRFL